MNPSRPLQGVRVIDYSHFLAGPFMGRCLSALGADVIKVERPKEGDAGRAHGKFVDGQSGYFLQQNMGKRGVCVNIKDARGLDMLKRLIETADVFVENYRPGALAKLGLGYAELSKLNPRLIYCSVSAYGHTGPYADRPGFGLIAEAMSGAMAQLGNPGEAPPLFRMPIADMYAGIHGVAAVCAALLGRATSGRGQHIDLSLYDCMISMHDYAVQRYTLSGGEELPRQTGRDQPDSAVYGSFKARDGYLVIAAQVNEAWSKLARLVGGEALAADARFNTPAERNAHSTEAVALVETWTMAQPSRDACLTALDAAGVPAAPIQRIDEVIAHPQTIARGMIVEQQHPVLGKVQLPNLPFRFSDTDTSPTGPAPLLGQHNSDLAAELGFSPEEIEVMARDGVLYAEPAARKQP